MSNVRTTLIFLDYRLLCPRSVASLLVYTWELFYGQASYDMMHLTPKSPKSKGMLGTFNYDVNHKHISVRT